jgi:hypothetical protein
MGTLIKTVKLFDVQVLFATAKQVFNNVRCSKNYRNV